MAVFIKGSHIANAALNSNAGIYIGQNILDGWDSSSPLKAAGSLTMGDFNIACSFSLGYFDLSILSQPTYDADFKNNAQPSIQYSRGQAL